MNYLANTELNYYCRVDDYKTISTSRVVIDFKTKVPHVAVNNLFDCILICIKVNELDVVENFACILKFVLKL